MVDKKHAKLDEVLGIPSNRGNDLAREIQILRIRSKNMTDLIRAAQKVPVKNNGERAFLNIALGRMIEENQQIGESETTSVDADQKLLAGLLAALAESKSKGGKKGRSS